MKNIWLELLLNLVEKTILELNADVNQEPNSLAKEQQLRTLDIHQTGKIFFIGNKNPISIRVFTHDEVKKISPASLQLMSKLLSMGVLDTELFELIMLQLLYYNARLITLEKTKEIILSTAANFLSKSQFAFLDIVLCSNPDNNYIN